MLEIYSAHCVRTFTVMNSCTFKDLTIMVCFFVLGGSFFVVFVGFLLVWFGFGFFFVWFSGFALGKLVLFKCTYFVNWDDQIHQYVVGIADTLESSF